jgi:hypothetical protein
MSQPTAGIGDGGRVRVGASCGRVDVGTRILSGAKRAAAGGVGRRLDVVGMVANSIDRDGVVMRRHLGSDEEMLFLAPAPRDRLSARP